jgi:hypothetical protein
MFGPTAPQGNAMAIVEPRRKDGKHRVTFCFGNGRRIVHLIPETELQSQTDGYTVVAQTSAKRRRRW